ncbi:B12-binding domain-containing radical SAM protein [candidate division WOR-3 bacterium]|nr:B12-binding domain-containing radical SAM protein [candidate division WOR-3 bacterium]
MKINLIYPNKAYRKGRQKAIRSFFRTPPLNLLFLAGLTPRDIKVHIIDERYEPINFDEPVDLVAITAITSIAPRAYQIGDEFKKRGIPVILGGIHPSFLPDEALKHATTVVIGEAELIWEEVIKDFQSGKLKNFYRCSEYSDLKGLPMPRWDILPNRKKYIPFIQTTRGCPNNCEFCSVTTFSGRKIRTRPVDEVIKEIKALSRGFVVFVDDNIFAKPKYAKELFHKLTPLRIKWGSEASLNFIKNFELLKLAAQSGCRALFIGIESVSQKALDSMSKGFNKVKEFKSIIKKLHEYKIAVNASLIFGFDEDDKGVFEQTVKFLDDSRVDSANFSILTPLPGTRLYSKLKNADRIFEKDWSKYDTLHVTYFPKNMSIDELKKGLGWTYRKFYSFSNTFKRMFRSIGRCPFMIPANLGFFIAARRKLIID